MIWTFASLGLLLFIAAAFGFLTTVQSRSILSALHFAALFSIGLAWVVGHTSPLGWTAMWLGVLLESVAWGWFYIIATAKISRSSTNADTGRTETLTPSEPPAAAGTETPPSPESLPVTPATPTPSSSPRWQLVSHALERDFVTITPQVFLASLRRGGQRDARLVRETSATDFSLEASGLTLDVQSHNRPLDARMLAYCLSQTFDWNDAKAATDDHRAYVTFTTHAQLESSRPDWIRLHLRAALALAEFSRLLALVWPDAGRLLSPDVLRTQSESLDASAEICVTFRTFPLNDPPGAVLSDTVGLHALGLRDYQWLTPGEPVDSVVNDLFARVNRDFRAGKQPEEVTPITSPDHVSWSVSRGLSRFKPDRPVIEFQPRA